MTVKELSQLYFITREIDIDMEQIEELRTKAERSTSQLTGMPKGGSIDSHMERYAIGLADLAKAIESKQLRLIAERKRLEAYIDDISDSMTRLIFTYRFVNGLDWWGVADRIGGRVPDAYCRNLVYKYLKTHDTQSEAAI